MSKESGKFYTHDGASEICYSDATVDNTAIHTLNVLVSCASQWNEIAESTFDEFRVRAFERLF